MRRLKSNPHSLSFSEQQNNKKNLVMAFFSPCGDNSKVAELSNFRILLLLLNINIPFLSKAKSPI